jgi:putative transcriptional regulator
MPTKAQVKALGDQMQELLASVKATEKRISSEIVAGAAGRQYPEPDVKAIRERTGLSLTRLTILIFT